MTIEELERARAGAAIKARRGLEGLTVKRAAMLARIPTGTWKKLSGPLPPPPRPRERKPHELDVAAREMKRRVVEDALVAAGGNQTAAAVSLGMPLRRMQRMVAKLVGRERMAALQAEHGWPGVGERARWAREGRRAG